MVFTKTHSANRGTSTYTSEDGRTLYLPKSVGEHPEQITVEGLGAAPVKASTAKPKESKEDRKARLAAETPEQKAARRKQEALDAKNRADARLAKLGITV